MITTESIRRPALSILSAILLAGCSFISAYDSQTYANLTSLKADTTILLDDLAAPDNKVASAQLPALRKDLERAFEYEKGKTKNDETILQLSEIRKMIKGLADQLEKQGKVSATYLSEKREQLETAFGLAIATEKKKIEDKR